MNGTQDLPHSVEAEQGVLGSMLLGGAKVIQECRCQLAPDAFFLPAHKTIFSYIVAALDKGIPTDFITLTQQLRDAGVLDAVGGTIDGESGPGQFYLSRLFSFVPTPANVGYYLEIVQDKHRRRELVLVCKLLGRHAEDETLDISETVADAIRALSEETEAPEIAVPLMDLADTLPDEQKTLLGDRFLCVNGSVIFVGPSGIGKTTASVQQDTLWGLGRVAFGIKPARPLRILTVQAENDDGDLGEMARGVCKGLHLSSEDRAAIGDRVLYASERSRTGAKFLAEVVRPLLSEHRPDILRIDPLLAYIGGDINDAETTAAFLRNGLNPLLEEYHCAAILNHHTPKVINRDTSAWRSSDWMYAGAGSADLTNWCRAALVIDATHVPHVFKFIAAKRGGRIGWCNEDGERVYERYFRHDTGGGLFWREATEEDMAAVEASKPGRKGSSKTKADFLALVPLEGAIPKTVLFSLAQTNGVGADKRCRGFLDELIDGGELYVWRVPRPKTNPEVRISRHEQTLI